MSENKKERKMTQEQLQQWIAIRKKCHIIKPKKGKGSYNRKATNKGE